MSLKAAMMLGLAGKVAPIFLDAQKSQTIAAYSVSKLFTTSALSMRLRRDSDNTEQDFGFAGNMIDLVAIATFAGSANLYASKVYDQSGNGRDWVQATAGSQPKFLPTGGSNNSPRLLIRNQAYMVLVLAQSPPFTLYSFIKVNAYNYFYTVIGLANADVSNAIVMQPSAEGNYIGLAMGVAWQPKLRSFLKLGDWGFFRHGDTAGNGVFSIDDNAVIGNNSNFAARVIGSNSATRLVLGDPGFPVSFDFSALVYTNVETAVSDHRNIVACIKQQFLPNYGAALYTKGDSITQGSAASDEFQTSYAELVAKGMSLNLVNYGVQGTDVYNPGSSFHPNLNEYFAGVDYGTNKNSYIIGSWGANSANVTDPLWAQYLEDDVINVLSKGFKPNHVMLLSELYQSNKDAQLQACNAIMVDICTRHGIVYANGYQAGLDNGGDSLLVDGTHPNDTGHALLATVVMAAFAAAA